MPSGAWLPAESGKSLPGGILGDGMDPISSSALLTAGSNVLGKALSPAPVGPSRADASSGISVNNPDFGSFAVSFGSGSVSTSQNPSWILPVLAGVAVIAMFVWYKAQKK